MPGKNKVFRVTKSHSEKGLLLQTQYVVEARSKKEAMEKVLEEEDIFVEEAELTPKAI